MTTRREFNRCLLGVAAAAALPGSLAGCAASPVAARVTAIDTHAHIFKRGLKLADVRRYAPGYDALAEDYLRMLDENGMSHGVLVQPSFLGTDNSFMVAALRRYRQRLRGIAVVAPDASVQELDKLEAAGVVGIRLNLIGLPIPDFSMAPWPALLQQVVKRDWQVEVHREARDLRGIVDPLLSAGVNVVVDHFGRPDKSLGVDDPGFRYLLSVGPTRRLWVKISAAYRNGPAGAGEATARAAIPLLRSAFGAERLLWGSDWPHTQFEMTISYPAVRTQLSHWLPDASEQRVILAETPTKLFRFG